MATLIATIICFLIAALFLSWWLYKWFYQRYRSFGHERQAFFQKTISQKSRYCWQLWITGIFLVAAIVLLVQCIR